MELKQKTSDDKNECVYIYDIYVFMYILTY